VRAKKEGAARGVRRGRVRLHREFGSVTRSGATPTGGPPSVGGLREGEAGTGWAGGRRWAGGKRKRDGKRSRLGREREEKKLGRVKRFWAAGKKEKEREGERKLGRLG